MRLATTGSPLIFGLIAALGAGGAYAGWRQGGTRSVALPTTIEDFTLPGTQPDLTGQIIDPIVGSMDGNCVNCHADFDAAYTEAEARAVGLLQVASDMALSQQGDDLLVRGTNYSGHKLPTGYPEGRRMRLHVRFLDADGVIDGADLGALLGAWGPVN